MRLRFVYGVNGHFILPVVHFYLQQFLYAYTGYAFTPSELLIQLAIGIMLFVCMVLFVR